jgi:hypothetical protein
MVASSAEQGQAATSATRYARHPMQAWPVKL